MTGRADDARGEKLLASGSDDATDSPNDLPYDIAYVEYGYIYLPSF